MVATRGQSLNRGASILSALVFVALLSGVAASVQYLSPYSHSESQTATVLPPTETPKKEIKQECKAGYVNKVNVKDAKFVQDTPTQCWKKDDATKPAVKASNAPECKDSSAEKCKVVACVPAALTKDKKEDVCRTVGEFDPKIQAQLDAYNKLQAGAPKDWAKMMQEQGTLGALPLLQQEMNAADQKALSDAFADPLKTATQETKKQIENNQSAIDGITRYLKACPESLAGNEKCDPEVVKSLEAQKKEIEAANEKLKQQMKTLSEAQTAMKPPQQCPTGTTGTPPNCTRADTGCGSNCGPGNGTTGFDKGLGSLLSGLAKGLGSTPPVAPPAAPAQACQTDANAYQQQQQQYQQALQQYNYQLQMYNQQQQQSSMYGTPAPVAPVQPQPCTPSTGNQCQSQPRQPDAGACTTGTWRATYTGACVTGWQCISTTGPKAELSCEPQTADVGMTLAVTYGCSSGVASSSAFKVTTQPGGSATTTVANPPAGTNTATYTLACTDNGKTTGAQCSVQVSRANIILVANPKTVPANGTSLLSWLTTGMQSCVISSPDQADFTARNSSNTSVTGAATTSPIATSARFLLRCETVSGGVKEATTTVQVQ